MVLVVIPFQSMVVKGDKLTMYLAGMPLMKDKLDVPL